jgi:cardiolipin synthase
MVSLLDQAFTRAAGAPLVAGNAVRLLRNAAENYPAWLAAIDGAEHKIYFENYIFRDDEVGLEFSAALQRKARAGVTVRLIYDWFGGFGKTSRKFWRGLRDAGVEVRCFNPPQFMSPVESLNRDHRKMIAVDGRVGFVTGLCVGREWIGDREAGVEPWRDTGIEVRGPALCDIERAFAQVWAATGAPLQSDELVCRENIADAGDVSLRIVANAPGTTGIFRLDQLIAAAARRTLWLTDAYFAGIPPYLQALKAAALDGVDVRLLVPGASDIPILRPLSQTGYRPLLEAGIRVFEWKGTMLHAKTAVSDGRWSRVGSSNLNLASWIGNYELDAVIEDERFAAALEEMYVADLGNSTEIVLHPRRRRSLWPAHAAASGRRRAMRWRREPGMSSATGSGTRVAAGALRLGRTVGAALTDQRVLESSEARSVAIVGIAMLGLAIVGIAWPPVLALPLAALFSWLAITLLARAQQLRRARRARGQPVRQLTRSEQLANSEAGPGTVQPTTVTTAPHPESPESQTPTG